MRRAFLFLLLAAAFTVSAARAEFFIRDGDVVCFWGNSITDYGVYPRMIENYVATRFPDWKVEFYNLGWGGDRTSNVDRLRRDIQLCRPTKVLVMLGMNDGGYRPFDPRTMSVYLDSLRTEIAIFRERSNPEIVLISPTTYDLRVRLDQVTGEVEDLKALGTLFYPSVLERYSWELGRLAELERCGFIDLNRAFTRHNERVGIVDGSYVLTKEGVHPNADGQFQMGLVILQGLGATDLTAESVIDAAAGRVTLQRACTVSGLSVGATGVSFTRMAGSLPLPVYPSTRELIKHVLDYPDCLDRDILRVTGLLRGWHELVIDGRRIDILSAGELEYGVNLSRYPHTPQMIQAYKVFEQTEKRNAAFYEKWRGVLLKGVGSPRDFTPFKTGVDTDALDRAEREAFEARLRLNKPVAHRCEIRPVKAPAPTPSRAVPVNSFLDDMVRVRITVDASTIPDFRPPLTVKGNFSHAANYGWGIVEVKNYYTDYPVRLYDDGTNGDVKANDGIWTLEMHLRRNSGRLRFGLHDGEFERLYWNPIERDYFVNPWCERISRAWNRLLGGSGDGWLEGVELSRDVELNWDRKAFEKALAEGRLNEWE